jgi:hypothetical protein
LLAHTICIPDHHRNRVPRRYFFLTVNLRESRSELLAEHIDALRDAVGKVRGRSPVHSDA